MFCSSLGHSRRPSAAFLSRAEGTDAQCLSSTETNLSEFLTIEAVNGGCASIREDIGRGGEAIGTFELTLRHRKSVRSFYRNGDYKNVALNFNVLS